MTTSEPNPRPPRDADYFDRWYADMAHSTAKDEILQRALGQPAGLDGGGLLAWDGVLEIADRIGKLDGGVLVDAACGRGVYGIEVARRSGARLVGVDFSQVALDRAVDNATRQLGSGSAEFRHGTLTSLGLDGGSADALMCTDGIQFAEPMLAGLLEFRRVLRPGGALVLTTWQATDPADNRIGLRLREVDLARDLSAAGFTDIHVEERTEWRAAERRIWEHAVSTPNPDSDPALQSLYDEGVVSLADFDSLQRVTAWAVAPA